MNILPHLKAAGDELSAIAEAGTPGEIVAHIDEAIRQLTLMSTQIEDAFPHEIGGLRAAQMSRDV